MIIPTDVGTVMRSFFSPLSQPNIFHIFILQKYTFIEKIISFFINFNFDFKLRISRKANLVTVTLLISYLISFLILIEWLLIFWLESGIPL